MRNLSEIIISGTCKCKCVGYKRKYVMHYRRYIFAKEVSPPPLLKGRTLVFNYKRDNRYRPGMMEGEEQKKRKFFFSNFVAIRGGEKKICGLE